MNVRRIKLTALEPINYYYQPSGRGNRSSPFIGDIALKYSMIHQLGVGYLPEPDKFKPTYEELRDYDFWFTVAVPGLIAGVDQSDVEFFKPIIRNTMQGIDYNGTNTHPMIKVGQIMYKNFFFQQPIKPGNSFYALFLDNNGWNLPNVLRVGNGRTGLLKVEEINNRDFNAYLNLYTLRNIIGLDEERIRRIRYEYAEHVVLQYFVIGPLDPREVGNIYGG